MTKGTRKNSNIDYLNQDDFDEYTDSIQDIPEETADEESQTPKAPVFSKNSIVLNRKESTLSEEIQKAQRELRQERMVQIMKNYHSGDPAKKQKAMGDMVKELERFIYTCIDRYAHNFKPSEKNEDIFNECCIAIFESMDGFDPSKGTATTYFSSRLVHAIIEYVNQNLNRVSQHFSKIAKSVRIAQKELQNMQIEPTVELIAAQSGLNIKHVEIGLEIIRASDEQHFETDTEFDAVIHERGKSPEAEYLEAESARLWTQAFKKYNKDSVKMFEMYYGIFDTPMSYTTIGKQFGISPKRVSIIVEKLRRMVSHNQDLRKYYHYDEGRAKRKVGENALLLSPSEVSMEDYDFIEESTEQMAVNDFLKGIPKDAKKTKKKTKATKEATVLLRF